MKIRELLEQEGEELGKFSSYGHTRDSRIISKYMDDDCVVAYVKEKLGLIFIIRSNKKYFSFVSLKTGIFYLGGYDYKLTEISIKEAKKLMGEDIIIVDKDLFGNLNKYLIVSSL